jgi:hypothetical protein
MASESTSTLAKLKGSLANVGRHERVLALEVRPQKYGFAVLEGPDALLDWGVRSHRNGLVARAGRIDSLLESYSPHFVVLRHSEHNSRQAANAVRAVTVKITIEARRHSVQTQFISGKKIRRFFARNGCVNKHQIASLLAEWFEELSWKLPPKRRLWQSEHYNMMIFDAVGTAMAFIASERSR